VSDAGASSSNAGVARAERRVRAYVEDIEPFLPAQAARLLTQALLADKKFRPLRVLDLGGGTGDLARELLAAWPKASLELVEPLTGVGELARARFARLGLAAQTKVHVGAPLHLPLAFSPRSFDVVVANLLSEEVGTPAELLEEGSRLLKPKGRFAATIVSRGSWAELTNVFRETLRDLGRPEAVAALAREEESLPDAALLTTWARDAGLVDVEIELSRFTLLFRSAREFFYAPLVESGPLLRWKAVAGHGEHLQDAFFFTKEALETYFATVPSTRSEVTDDV